MITLYCGVCNAPVNDWDSKQDYGQCENGHSVRAAFCTEQPDKKLSRRIRRRELYKQKKNIKK